MSLSDKEVAQLHDDGGFQEDMNRLRQDQAYFGLCWPNHCTKCGGWGAFHWLERHDPGYPGEPMSDPCHDCVVNAPFPDGKCICSRCSVAGLTPEGEGPCDNCGWNYDDGYPTEI